MQAHGLGTLPARSAWTLQAYSFAWVCQSTGSATHRVCVLMGFLMIGLTSIAALLTWFTCWGPGLMIDH